MQKRFGFGNVCGRVEGGDRKDVKALRSSPLSMTMPMLDTDTSIASATSRSSQTSSKEDVSSEVAELKQAVLKLGVTTCRGERASAAEKATLRRLVMQLIGARTQAMKGLSCEGEWDLVMSDTQLFRSSPFFMAGRAVVRDGEQADQFNWFCDQHRAALDFSQIGRVRQVEA